MHLKAGRIEVFVNKIVNEQVQITLWSCSENQFTTFLEIKGVTFSRFVAIAIKRKLFKDCLFKCVRLVSRRSNILSAFTYILSFYLFVESINIICSVTVPRKTVNEIKLNFYKLCLEFVAGLRYAYIKIQIVNLIYSKIIQGQSMNKKKQREAGPWCKWV